MDTKRRNPAIAQAIQAHQPICTVRQAKPILQLRVYFGILENVRGGMKSEISEELLLGTEDQPANSRVDPIGSDK
jgi:hypothetical protein